MPASRRSPYGSWLDLSMNSLMLAAESQAVISMRLTQFALGGAGADEARLMVTEKLQAAAEAQVKLVSAALEGVPQLGPARAVAHYRRKVRANQRRLSRRG